MTTLTKSKIWSVHHKKIREGLGVCVTYGCRNMAESGKRICTKCSNRVEMLFGQK